MLREIHWIRQNTALIAVLRDTCEETITKNWHNPQISQQNSTEFLKPITIQQLRRHIC